MTVSVAQVMREVRNFFPAGTLTGTWTLAGGTLSGTDALRPGDWIVIRGSRSHDGVHQLGAGLTLPSGGDEVWTGEIVRLAPPGDFLALCADIAAWAEKHPPETALRESFGAYSVTRAAASGGKPVAWQSVFSAELAPYRRMYPEVTV